MITDKPPSDPWEGAPSHSRRRSAKADRPGTIWHWSVLDESQILLGVVGLLGVVVLILIVRSMLPASDGCRDPSCAAGEPIGVTWIEEQETLAAYHLPCGDEVAKELLITDLRTGDLLWHVTGNDATSRRVFIAGQVTEPYVEQVALEPLPVGKLELTVIGDYEYVLPFERSDLFGDFLFINGVRVSRSEFESEAMKVGGCAAREALVESDNGLLLTSSLVALAGAAATMLALRMIDRGTGAEE